jgi:hypothetical protein
MAQHKRWRQQESVKTVKTESCGEEGRGVDRQLDKHAQQI